jgi:hypothetical protein
MSRFSIIQSAATASWSLARWRETPMYSRCQPIIALQISVTWPLKT